MLPVQRPGEADSGDSDSKWTLRRPLGLGAGAIGAPAAMSFVDPRLAEILTTCELSTFLAIVAVALFGTPTLSERAFRLLRWLANRPEHVAPSTSSEHPGQDSVNN